MSQVETPVLPQGRNVANSGKDAKAKGTIAGREEKGSAFRALLQSVNGKPGRGPVAKGEKGSESAGPQGLDEGAAVEVSAIPDLSAAQAMAPQPATAPAADAAARLLGALQLPARDAAEPRNKEPVRRDTAMAALSSALAGAKGPRAPDGAKPAPAGPAGEPGIAMPSDDTAPKDTPDLSALSRLSELVDDKASSSERTSGEAAPAKPLSLTVTRQETYLPPVMRISPFQQVVEPLRQAAAELVSSRSDTVPDIGSDTSSEISAPTKILHIELKPVELGTITVKMRLAQGGMEIRIEASRAETAQMLASDKDALREVVKASGFSPDAVSVETVHVDTMASDRQPGNPGPGGDDRSSAGRDGQGRAFDQSRQQENRQDPRQRGLDADPASIKDETHDLAHELDASNRLRHASHRYL